MATAEERVTALETEFRTELRHLATKSDLAHLENRLMRWMLGSVAAAVAVLVAVERLWPS